MREESTKAARSATEIASGEEKPTMTAESKPETNGKGAIDARLMAALPVATLAVDSKGRVTHWSARLAELTGRDADEMVGKRTWQGFYSSRKNTPIELALRSEEEECDDTFAVTHRATKETTTVRFSARPVLDDQDELLGAVAALDEAAADEEGKKAREQLMNLPTPVMEIDRDFNVKFLNTAGANVVGLTPETAKGRKCYDLFKTPHCRTQNCRCAQAMQFNEPRTGETIADPTGLNLPIQYTGTPVHDASGNVVGALEYVIDVTATRRAMDDALEKVEYLNNVPTPVMVIDREYNVEYMNPAGAGLLGETAEGVKGRKCFELFKTPHCRTQKCACHQAMHSDQVTREETVADPNGLNLPIEYTGAPIRNSNGQVIGALEYVVDITDRKKVLKDIIQVAQEMAQGNLTTGITNKYEGDYKAIADNLNRAVRSTHDALARVAESVEQVSSATRQIASSSQSVAQGASEQASSLEETSSSLEEIASMTRQNADNTMQAKTLAQSTKEAAEKGGGAMQRMTDAMGKIRAASEGTAQIIKDINEIAFQTNLLALNAAVEAARAGDAGRGFAVVAEEVRNLALRSKEAAQKTEDLIKEAVSHAENGRVISDDVATNLNDIVSSVGKVNDIVTEIAIASQEQSRGIEQVNKTVSEMDKVVQAAAANAEESSSAAEELSGQAEEMATLVGRFELHREKGLGKATRALPARAPDVPLKHLVSKTPRADDSSLHFSPEELIPLEGDTDFADF
jgi:methyl-accepting chemotaxis protein